MNAESNGDRVTGSGGTTDGAAVRTGDTPGGGTAEEGSEEQQPGEQKGRGSRAPRVIQSSRPLHLSWRVAVFLIGLAIVIGGIILLPLPGPGWVVIFCGVAVWATEFVWAQRLLRWTKGKFSQAADSVRSRRRSRKRADMR